MELMGSIPYAWMGLLALGILWLNTLLIAAVAFGRRRALGRLRARFIAARASGALTCGVVERGEGPGDALATRHVEQVGRALTVSGPDRILFTDGASRGELHGGVVRGDDGASITVEPRSAEVWIEAAPARADAEFDQAWSRASTNKGYRASIDLRVERGAKVWIHRDPDRDDVLVSTLDPIALCHRKCAVLASFAAGAVLTCALVTVIACWPPVFGLVSTIGGALALAFFLMVQPLGTAARDAAKLPSERLVGGTWQRPTR